MNSSVQRAIASVLAIELVRRVREETLEGRSPAQAARSTAAGHLVMSAAKAARTAARMIRRDHDELWRWRLPESARAFPKLTVSAVVVSGPL